MLQIEGPSKSYYRAPYPILSFLVSLYCDAKWSLDEFEKWKRSERTLKVEKKGQEEEEIYMYHGYLDPYADMPLAVARIIYLDVPKSLDVDAQGRRKPSNKNFADFWPYLVNELSLPPRARQPERAFPTGTKLAPLLSALAEVFLLDNPVGDDAPFAAELRAVVASRHAPDFQAKLEALREPLGKELTSTFCW